MATNNRQARRDSRSTDSGTGYSEGQRPSRLVAAATRDRVAGVRCLSSREHEPGPLGKGKDGERQL